MNPSSNSTRLILFISVTVLMFAVCSGIPLATERESTVRCGIRPFDDKALRAQMERDLERISNVSILDKISYGHDAAFGEYPWMAKFEFEEVDENLTSVKFHQVCGAAIISEHWLITAAHCVYQMYPGFFRIAISNDNRYKMDKWRQVFPVDNYFIYDKFESSIIFAPNVDSISLDDSDSFDFDIALLKIQPDSDGRGIKFNNYVQPVCLPDYEEPSQDGQMCLFSGWGDTNYVRGKLNHMIRSRNLTDEKIKEIKKAGESPELLQGNTLPIWNHEKCITRTKSYFHPFKITNNMICAGYIIGGSSNCKGDSGGPLVCKVGGIYKLTGTDSYGLNTCDGHNVPMLMVRVSLFVPWIKSTIKNNSLNSEEAHIPRKPEVTEITFL